MASPLVHEKVWFEKPKFEAAERQYYEKLAKVVFDCCINAPAFNSSTLPLSASQAQLKAFSLMDNKAYLSAEKFSGASCYDDSAVRPLKVGVDGEDGTGFSPANLDTTIKEDKRTKKEKKIRNKEKKREVKKDQVNSKPGDQENFRMKTSSFAVPSMKESNPAASYNTEAKSFCEKVGISQALEGLPKTQGCPAINSKSATKVIDILKGTENPPRAQLVNKSSVLENLHLLTQEDAAKRMCEEGSSNSPMKHSLASEVAKARQHIKQSLECMDDIAAMAGSNSDLINRINVLEKENADLKKVLEGVRNLALGLESRVKILEGGKSTSAPVSVPVKPVKTEDDDDDGVDLFGSDSEEESEEAARIKEQRLAAYAEKKSKKPALIAKSNIILSVSPWDDETDMKKLEECVRSVQMDGLVWGASKLVPLAYGIHKLHISCVVEDEKVSVDLLQENIQNFEDYVQSVDIAAFNKV